MLRLWKFKKRETTEGGATAVEMALITPVFFMLLIGITETSMIETAQQLMENAAYNTSRLAKTGYTAAGQSQSQTVTGIMNKELQAFGSFFDTTKITMTSLAYSSFTAAAGGTGGTNGLGTTQQIVVYTFTYPWKIFTPMIGNLIGTDGKITLTAKIVVHNEPY